jgi:hypothetical protein
MNTQALVRAYILALAIFFRDLVVAASLVASIVIILARGTFRPWITSLMKVAPALSYRLPVLKGQFSRRTLNGPATVR